MSREAGNVKNLRVIKTARSRSAINAAAEEGFRPLIKAVAPGARIHARFAVYQHKETGKIEVSGGCRWPPGADYEQVVPFTYYYPYHFKNPFAAYLIPPDLEEGETVWLEDVIADIVAV